MNCEHKTPERSQWYEYCPDCFAVRRTDRPGQPKDEWHSCERCAFVPAPAKPCTCHKPLEDAGQWALCSGCSKRICPGCAEWFDHDMRNTGECHECAALSAAKVA